MRRCASCGEESPETARFCPACGSPLAVAAAAALTERKVISVLFADLVGFTARAEQLDVEDVHGTLSPYHRLLRRELERFGGTVEKFIGDAVMAVFGAPVAHEDDAERAVRAGLAIQAAVAELRDSDPTLDLHVRIGITTGQALVALGADPSRGEGMASGDVVNSAARLQSAAPIDGVLVGRTTFEATRRVIVYEPTEPVVAKGKAEPLEVWVAERPRSVVGGERIEEGAVSLVGRRGELDALTAALRRVRETESVQLVSLLGAPGLGKSRLVAELFAHLSSEPELTTWRPGRCMAYGDGHPFWALGEMVKAQAGILESDGVEVSERRLCEAVGALIDDESDAAWVERQLFPLVGLDTAASPSAESGQVEAFAAWRQFLEALAEQRPTVLVFEDLHWADDGLLDFIDLLAERALGVPLLLLCTARPELLERRPGWGGGKTNVLTVALSPLSEPDTARLVSALLDQTLLPAQLQAALLARADGNPLYAQEYVAMLRDRGLLVRDAGGWRLADDAKAAELPATVQGIIAARLDALAPAEKRLMQNTAVIGRVAWVSAAAAVGEQAPAQIDELLYALERKQLLRRARRSSMAGEVEFSFAHALIQDVAYGQIPRAGRAERHLRAAGWIEAQSSGRDDKAELLAHHYGTALSLLRQTGEAGETVTMHARDAFAEASRQASALNQHAVAARHITEALALTAADDPARAPMQLARAKALWMSGEADEASLAEARDAQVAAGDFGAAAEISLLLSRWHWNSMGDGEGADAHAERAAAFAERGAAPAVAAEIAAARVHRLAGQERNEEAVVIADLAIERAEQAGVDLAIAPISLFRGAARVALGDLEGIQEMEASARALAAQYHTDTMLSYGNLANVCWAIGELDRARAHLDSAQLWSDRFSTASMRDWLTAVESEHAYHRGEWDEALRLAEPAITGNFAFHRMWATLIRARILVGRGPRSNAAADAIALVTFGREKAQIEMVIASLGIRALAERNASGALAACDAFLVAFAQAGYLVVPHLAAIAPILARAGRHADLRAAMAGVKVPSKWMVAILATADGRYADAAAVYADIGSRPDEAAAHLLDAEDHLAHARRADADKAAAAAVAIYGDLGATLYLRQSEALFESPAEASKGA